MAAIGGCVMHDVSTSRGASGKRCDCQIRLLPTSRTSAAKIMWGSIPFAHWPRNSARSSEAARGASYVAMPIATKHESHSH